MVYIHSGKEYFGRNGLSRIDGKNNIPSVKIMLDIFMNSPILLYCHVFIHLSSKIQEKVRVVRVCQIQHQEHSAMLIIVAIALIFPKGFSKNGVLFFIINWVVVKNDGSKVSTVSHHVIVSAKLQPFHIFLWNNADIVMNSGQALHIFRNSYAAHCKNKRQQKCNHFFHRFHLADTVYTNAKKCATSLHFPHIRAMINTTPHHRKDELPMRIALINENSQAAKNAMIEASLKKVVEPMGHTVINYGMYTAEDECQLTYVKCGLLASLLLTTGAADYVVTGCGTGEGAMLACNSFPGVLCGHLVDPSDGYMFAQINDGNCVSLPFAKGFGWGAELNLEMIFQQLFGFGHGNGYPKERVVPEQRNKKILDGVKAITYRPLIDILHDIDQDFLKETISGEHFAEYFYPACQDEQIAAYLKQL